MSICILVVDDSSMVRVQVRSMLLKNDYEVIEAGDGLEALRKLEENPHVGMLILDVHMPHMNGLELLEVLSGRGFSRPILFLSAEADPEVIRHAQRLGARAWLVKPVRLEALLTTVAKELGSLPQR